MTAYCEVCRGNKRIRVAIYRPVDVLAADIPVAPDETETSREYPCPECSAGDTVPFERISVGRMLVNGRSDIIDPKYQRAMQFGLADQLAHHLIERNLLIFNRGPADARNLTYPLRGTVGLVAPVHVAKLEERVAERQFEVAEAVIEATAAEIANWGSYYHGREGGSVGKWQALEWMRDALAKVRKKYG